MALSPAELQRHVGSGLLSFPVTDFAPDGSFDAASYRGRLEWLQPFGAVGLFAAGGTGEFFSLAPDEYADVIRTAVEVCGDRTPIIAGVGYGTRMAVLLARIAEKEGASGILILPHYLTEATQDGLIEHVVAICNAVHIGVIVYNRSVCRLAAESVAEIAERCPNLIGFKDGIGDIESMMTIFHRLGDRLVYLGGLPTAEVFAPAYLAMGVNTYSSAVFNFIPRTAKRFYDALQAGDRASVDDLLKRFFFPLIALRNRRPGYAVSMIKAGARLVGRDAGPVRSPLTELAADEVAILGRLVDAVGGA